MFSPDGPDGFAWMVVPPMNQKVPFAMKRQVPLAFRHCPTRAGDGGGVEVAGARDVGVATWSRAGRWQAPPLSSNVPNTMPRSVGWKIRGIFRGAQLNIELPRRDSILSQQWKTTADQAARPARSGYPVQS